MPQLCPVLVPILARTHPIIALQARISLRQPAHVLQSSFGGLSKGPLISEVGPNFLRHAVWVQDLAVSSGSACTSASLEPSYVLRALGVEEDMAHTSLRFGIGRFTTEAEVDRAIALTVQHVSKLREMSPLWEMVQEGVDIKNIQWSQH